MPSSLRLEPMRLATGNAVHVMAGATLPATSVTVLNGAGQHVIRGFLAGEKHSFSVVQRLWRLDPLSGAPQLRTAQHFRLILQLGPLACSCLPVRLHAGSLGCL